MSNDLPLEARGRLYRLARHLVSVPVLAHAVCVAVVLLDWVIYYPGIAWGDSLIGTYTQAVKHSYDDWFPPFIAVTVRLLMACGLRFPAITLIQGLVGGLGVYQFAYAVTRVAFRDRFTEASARTLACGVFLVLFFFTALKFYLIYFCNDAWEMFSFLWVGVVWLRLIEQFPRLTPAQVRWRVGLATVLAVVAMLSRFNAVVMLPGFVLLTWLALRPQGWKIAVVFVLALVLLKPGADALIYQLAQVHREHPEDQIISNDLVGLCVEDETLRARFPYTSSQLVEDRYRAGYEAGNATPLTPWASPAPIIKDPARLFRWAHEPVAAEWRRALRICPQTLAIVKIKGFACHILCQTPNWYCDGIVENDLGLRQNKKFERVRLCVRELHERAYADPLLRLVIGRHPLWMFANALLLLALAAAYRVRRDRRLAFLTVLVALPMLYYLSYLLASANYCYRYMYPATLFVQIFTLALGTGFILMKVKSAARAFE